MHTHFKTCTASFANSFLLLVVVAGVLNIDLFESDVVAGHNDHRVLYRIELVFNAEHPSQSPVLSVYEDTPGGDAVKDRIPRLHFYATCVNPVLSGIEKTGQTKTRYFHSSHHAGSFNIPHQNSDEDEAFVLPLDVA